MELRWLREKADHGGECEWTAASASSRPVAARFRDGEDDVVCPATSAVVTAASMGDGSCA